VVVSSTVSVAGSRVPHDYAVIGLVERHGKVLAHGQRPTRQLLRGAIDHHDLLQIRDTYINVRAILFQLEGFRLAPEFIYFIETLVGHRVYRCDRGVLLAITTANVNALGHWVVAHVIGATVEIKGGDELVRVTIVDVDLALLAGHKQFVGVWRKGHALRIRQPR